MRRWCLGSALVVALVVAASSPASARVTTARLTFERALGAELCPTPEAVRAAVARRLDRDPFTVDGTTDIRCVVSGDAGGLHARISIADDPGAPPTERIISSPRTDCRELAEAIELVLSIAINPRLALVQSASPPVASGKAVSADEGTPAPATPSVSEPGPNPVPAPPEPPPSAPPTPSAPLVATASPVLLRDVGSPEPHAPRTWDILVGVEALGSAGLGPGLAPGAGIEVGLSRKQWSLELDGRAVASSSTDVAGGSVSAWLASLSIAPCRHFAALAACAVAGAGVLRGRGEGFAITDATTLPTFSAGARVAWEKLVGDNWWMRVSAELNAVLGRATLQLDGNDAWMAPRINGVLVLSGGKRFR